MLDLKISQLRMVLAIADTGTVTAAAERLGRTPPAVSMALAQLEEQLGAPLFPNDRKDTLSDLGRFVVDLARNHVREHDRMTDAITAFQSGEQGRVSLCAVPSVAGALLPDVLQSFVSRYPKVQIDARDTDTVSMTALLANGSVEIGIGGPPRDSAISFTPLFEDRLLLISSLDRKDLSPSPPLTLKDVSEMELLGSGIIDELLPGRIRSRSSESQLNIRNTTSLLGMIKVGLGRTILPELAIPKSDRASFDIRQIGNPPVTRQIGLLHRANIPLSPAAENFVVCLKEQIALVAKARR